MDKEPGCNRCGECLFHVPKRECSDQYVFDLVSEIYDRSQDLGFCGHDISWEALEGIVRLCLIHYTRK